jgi:signal transduction histidine kinase
LRDDGRQGAQRRVAALAATAAALVPRGSLAGTLDGLAGEVFTASSVAGVQILTPGEGEGGGGEAGWEDAGWEDRGLAAMGSAGFRRWPDFFDRLVECRRRGATLHSYDAFRRGEPVVVTNRWAAIRNDPAWAPMREYLGELAWESWVSIPLRPVAAAGQRSRAAGVLNVFLAPGEPASERTLAFLAALAEQAGIAVGYAAAIGAAREAARQEERQRLARELHDRVVQQVFSISMQAASLRLLSERAGHDALTAAAVDRAAADIGTLALGALDDLRTMVSDRSLPPSPALGAGLAAAARALPGGPAGPRVAVSAGPGVDAVGGEVAEDAYRVIAEAVHNVVKHAQAQTVRVRLTVRDGRLLASVTDDGRGLPAAGAGSGAGATPSTGHGLRVMRERAERWGGRLTVGPGRAGGTAVRLVIPLPDAGAP